MDMIRKDILEQLSEEFWLNQFAEEVIKTTLPIFTSSHPAPSAGESSQTSRAWETLDCPLPDELYAQLMKGCKDNFLAFYIFTATAVSAVLQKYTGHEDILLGTTGFKNEKNYLPNNILFLRSNIEQDASCKELLNTVKKNVTNLIKYQGYAFSTLWDRLLATNRLADLDIFTLAYVVEPVQEAGEALDRFDLVIRFTGETKRSFHFAYNPTIYAPETIEQFSKHLVTFLHKMVSQLDSPHRALEILSAEEREELIWGLNQNEADFSREKTVYQIFEEHAAKCPEAIALQCGDQQLTYRELNERVNQLAYFLRAKGVTQDQPVGILLERSSLMVECILAIWKAGGAYIPLDVKYPGQRIAGILTDSEAPVLLTLREFVDFELMTNYSGTIIKLDRDEAKIRKESVENPNLELDMQSLAYVIYTSGSTGKPKGAMVEHIGMMNHLQAKINDLQLTASTVVSENASHCFDISVWQFFVALVVGGKTIIYPNDLVLNPDQFINQVILDQVTILEVVPSYLSAMLDTLELKGRKLPAIQYLLVTGETVKPQLVTRWFKLYPEIKMVNAYGPTEASDDICHFMMVKDPGLERIPVGKPVQNFHIYIVNEEMQLCPKGVIGEICVSGVGVGRGYLNDAEKTAKAFLPDPFVAGEVRRMYKTGDLGRWTLDGTIDFLGRKDYQVKIRGFRIELGEIENRLLNHPNLKEAVVVDQEDGFGNKYLCAYIVVHAEPEMGELKEYLALHLPEYMVPAHFVQLPRLPLNANGKIDRKALPVPDLTNQAGSVYQAPADEVEEKLAQICGKILSLEKVSSADDFFQLGGHSLNAMTLVAEIYKEFNVEIPLVSIFEKPTVVGMAEFVRKSVKTDYQAIQPSETQDYYPVSSAQKRLYILDQFEGNNLAYHLTGTWMIEGALDVARFEQALHQLVNRHEALRTSFDFVAGEVVQRIAATSELKVMQRQVTLTQAGEIVRNFIQPFNLRIAPLLRVALLEITAEQHLLVFDLHHIIADGTSMNVLVSEFASLYAERELPALRIQYKDFVYWQNQLFASDKFAASEAYWLEQFRGEIPVLELPTDYVRPEVMNFAGANYSFKLGKDLTAGLLKLAGEQGATLFMVLLAQYNILLSKYSGQDDLIIGTPIAGRNHADVKETVGMFANTLALRNQPGLQKTFLQFLAEVREHALAAFAHQDYQFEMLVEKLQLARELNRNPLFDTMFALRNFAGGEEGIDLGVRFSPYPFEQQIAKFDLSLFASEVDGEISFLFEYATGLFQKATIERMAAHLLNIIAEVVAEPAKKLSEIQMLALSERNWSLNDYNSTTCAEFHQTVHELIGEQVALNPDAIALQLGEVQMTYREMNARANQLARRLREFGIGRDQLVAIMIEHSLEMVIGVLGILKAGGAYLPLDATYPQERINYLLNASGAKVVLTQTALLDVFKEGTVPAAEMHTVSATGRAWVGPILDLQDEALYTGDASDLPNINQPQDLIYVIFTSGSTGEPKGVAIQHQGVVNYLTWAKKVYLAGEKANLALYSSLTFDLTVTSLFLPLISGNRVVIYDLGTGLEENIFQMLTDGAVQVMKLTPTHLRIIQALQLTSWSIKKFIVGGEDLSVQLAYAISSKFAHTVQIYNEYGPTETVVGCMIHQYSPEKDTQLSVPIGKPADNMQIYLLDEAMNPVAEGVTGEIYISGHGLARGYLHQPELTAQAFLPHPFRAGERIYRTGDLARRRGENLEFGGRKDQQVKIRGYRIELAEIAHYLLQYPAVSQAVVLDVEGVRGEKELVAYLVADQPVEQAAVRNYLAERLPGYMIPAYLVQVAELPVTTNGKLDRKALRTLAVERQSSADYQSPADELEATLVQIWAEELGLNLAQVGVTDNFFNLGGNSLKAIRILGGLHQALEVKVSLSDFFKYPTVQKLAQHLKTVQPSAFNPVVPAAEKISYALSSAQKRLFVLQQMNQGSTHYHIPQFYFLEEPVDVSRFEAAFQQMVLRHESLRTSFELMDGEPVQRIQPTANLTLEYQQVEYAEIESLVAQFVRPFDLTRAPLLRVGIAALPDSRQLLMVDIHHIISDGISQTIFIRELLALYAGEELPAVKIQYKDFSEWQNHLSATGVISKQEAYWLNQFAGELPVLQFPTDFPRPAQQSLAGDSIEGALSAELSEKLSKLAAETDATPYMVLLAAYSILLAKYANQEEVIIGSPVSGRTHPDLHNTIGMFVNMLAWRTYPAAHKSFTEFLAEIKQLTIEGFANQDYQFETLIQKLNLHGNHSRNPLFDTVLTLHNWNEDQQLPDWMKVTPYSVGRKLSRFDLQLFALQVDGIFRFGLEYCSALFEAATAEKILQRFQEVLGQVLIQPDMLIQDIHLTHGFTVAKALEIDGDFGF